jgi:hypothetical protein
MLTAQLNSGVITLEEDLIETFDWLAKSKTLHTPDYTIQFIKKAAGQHAQVNVIGVNNTYLGTALAPTYAEAFVKAVAMAIVSCRG